MIRSVAVIGVGAMGAPMARRLQAAGFELSVCDRNEAVTASFAQARARVATTPADCAGADLVIILVATPDQMRDVVLGERGLKAGLTSQRSPIVAVMSTVNADALESLAQALRPLGVRVIDAPVSGGVPAAEQGTLTIMTGGEAQDVEAARPVFASMGTQLIHCGALGAAQTMKIANNILGIANAVIAAEAYRLAAEHGLDLAHVSRVFEASTGRNFRSKDPAGPQAVYATAARDRAGFESLASIMRKDMGLAVELASRAQGAYPVVRGLKSLIESLGDETFANWRCVGGLPPDHA